MKFVFVIGFLLVGPKVFGGVSSPNLPAEGVMSGQNNAFLDPNVDYSQFYGRVSDKTQDDVTFKIKVENTNAKFFHEGDVVEFKVMRHSNNLCQAEVQSTELAHFVMRVRDLSKCWDGGYFKRGTVLEFNAPILQQRVQEASVKREQLIREKEEMMGKLNGVNHYLFGFDMNRGQVLTDYDNKIEELKAAKEKAINDLYAEKKSQSVAQSSMVQKLSELDEALDFYRIDRVENITDRFTLDHDTSAPVMARPK